MSLTSSLKLPAISNATISKGPAWLQAVANVETAHNAIETAYKATLASRLSAIEKQAEQFDPADRRSFIARNEALARRDALKELRDQSDALIPRLRELQFLKETTPDRRSMIASRATKAPHSFSAAMLACEGMGKVELKSFIDELLAEIATQAEGITNDQAAYVSAAMNRLGRMDRADRPYSTQEVAAAVRAPLYDENVAAVDQARRRLDTLESRWSDLRRSGAVQPLTKIATSLHKLTEAEA